MVFVFIIEKSKYFESTRVKVVIGFSRQKAFFNLFIDSERHFLFDSFFHGKYPFKGNTKQIFSKVFFFVVAMVDITIIIVAVIVMLSIIIVVVTIPITRTCHSKCLLLPHLVKKAILLHFGQHCCCCEGLLSNKNTQIMQKVTRFHYPSVKFHIQ